MPESRIFTPSNNPDIEAIELFLPNESDLGTGMLSVFLRPNAFSAPRPVTTELVNQRFRMVVTVNLLESVEVLLGQPRPIFQVKYRLPEDPPNPRFPHTIETHFFERSVMGCSIDKLPMNVM